MPTEKVLAFNTRKVKARVLSQRSGTALILEELIPGKVDEQFRSTHFNKFADGSEVECVFRVRPDGGAQLVSATLLDPNARYQIFISGLPVDVRGRFDEIMTTDMQASPADIAAIFAELDSEEGEGIVAVSPALTYDEARQWESYMLQELPGVSINYHKARKDARVATVTSIEVKTAPVLQVVPEWVGDHWLSEDERIVFGMAANVHARGGHLNVLLKGPSGYGKTSKLEALATFLNVPCITMDCSTVLETIEWFGYPEARDGSTLFVPTEFTEAIRRGNCVVILDEMNRIEPQISNSLFPLLDHRRATTVHNERIEVGPGVIFGMTVNLGIKYAGTHVIDAALTNRVDLGLEVGAMPQRVEGKMLRGLFADLAEESVDGILALVTELRKVVEKNLMDVDVSTRTSIKLGLVIQNGMTTEQAAKHVITVLAQNEDRKALQDSISYTLKNIKAGARP